MDLKLTNKCALVTGSTAGIGLAIATALLEEGVDVIINGRKQDSVDKVVADLTPKATGKVLGYAGDLSLAEEADKLHKQYPDVDILINNLGIFEPTAFEDISDDDWRRFFDINVLSGARLSRLYLPRMKQTNWGRIIFISSESAIQIPAEMIHYGMTKAAQIAVARGIAEDVAGTEITVNSVLPGPTSSRGVADFVNDLATQQGQTVEEFETDFFNNVRPTSLIKRFADTTEVASMVCYLASPLASATTGASIRVDGGVVKSAF
ncbi:hypothetical protein LCGC14_0647210 [marine sediment metagenome]|uniref:Short-chain dehydrogenase/reductase SDR n=2 Tax=root TaxID=1 RepID=A0A0F9RH05_9ZZZZ|nr:SDR family oxidoreductase [Methylophaga aminisulfidivorans]